jgi:hypothetical protein
LTIAHSLLTQLTPTQAKGNKHDPPGLQQHSIFKQHTPAYFKGKKVENRKWAFLVRANPEIILFIIMSGVRVIIIAALHWGQPPHPTTNDKNNLFFFLFFQ